jgi:hypothetical protein
MHVVCVGCWRTPKRLAIRNPSKEWRSSVQMVCSLFCWWRVRMHMDTRTSASPFCPCPSKSLNGLAESPCKLYGLNGHGFVSLVCPCILKKKIGNIPRVDRPRRPAVRHRWPGAAATRPPSPPLGLRPVRRRPPPRPVLRPPLYSQLAAQCVPSSPASSLPSLRADKLWWGRR